MKLRKTFSPLEINFRWILGVSFLFLLTLVFFFRFRISYNEMDVIPYARSVYCNDWLANDWYLNLETPYRFLFSFVVGFFADTYGFVKSIVVGRIISYLLIALSLNSLINSLKPKPFHFLYYLAIILVFTFFPRGYGAGEWIVGGLETKVFSYGFAILSISAFLNSRIKKGFLFAGLSLSFHPLVGIYNLFCLIPIFLLHQRKTKSFLIELFKFSPIFIVAAMAGIYGIVDQFHFIEESTSKMGWDVYVNIRVRHHTLPNTFPLETWVKLAIFSAVNIYFFTIAREKKLKMLSSYAIFSVVISMIGLITFFIFGSGHHLKYYFFRFSDSMLPLLTFINIASFIIGKTVTISSKSKNIIKYIIIALSFLIIIPKTRHFVVGFHKHGSVQQISRKSSGDYEMAKWVKNNTSKNEIFIIPPDSKFFYTNYERPIFVSWKHSPQEGKEMVEWYNRLKALNRGEDFQDLSEVNRNYLKLNEKEILAISRAYPELSYILMPQSVELNFPIAFKSKKNTLYKIKFAGGQTTYPNGIN